MVLRCEIFTIIIFVNEGWGLKCLNSFLPHNHCGVGKTCVGRSRKGQVKAKLDKIVIPNCNSILDIIEE